jgi:hypothetical protein
MTGDGVAVAGGPWLGAAERAPGRAADAAQPQQPRGQHPHPHARHATPPGMATPPPPDPRQCGAGQSRDSRPVLLVLQQAGAGGVGGDVTRFSNMANTQASTICGTTCSLRFPGASHGGGGG